MRIETEIKLDYSDVLLRPKRSTLGSRKSVDLTRGFTYKNYKPSWSRYPSSENYAPEGRKHYEGIPLMASNMDGVGTFDVADKLAEQGILTCLVKTYSSKELIDYFQHNQYYEGKLAVGTRTEYVAVSIGIQNQDLFKFKEVYETAGAYIKYVCIDVANGYSQRFIEFVSMFRKMYPEVVIIAGNVVTADQPGVDSNGADIVKVGIGPGSVCTTVQNWRGYPTIECADGPGLMVIIRWWMYLSGDVAKAFVRGADFVMLGGMLAGL